MKTKNKLIFSMVILLSLFLVSFIVSIKDSIFYKTNINHEVICRIESTMTAEQMFVYDEFILILPRKDGSIEYIASNDSLAIGASQFYCDLMYKLTNGFCFLQKLDGEKVFRRVNN